MKRLLAIDYGQVRTGLAWTDPEQRVALPLETVPTAQLWKRLSALLPEVEAVIIGYPRTLAGDPTDMTPQVEAFVATLQKKYPTLPVHYVDERLTTQAAAHYVRSLSRKERRDKGRYDQSAAAILLEAYLLRKK